MAAPNAWWGFTPWRNDCPSFNLAVEMETNSTEGFESNLQLAETMLNDMGILLVNALQYNATRVDLANTEPATAPAGGSRTLTDVGKEHLEDQFDRSLRPDAGRRITRLATPSDLGLWSEWRTGLDPDDSDQPASAGQNLTHHNRVTHPVALTANQDKKQIEI